MRWPIRNRLLRNRSLRKSSLSNRSPGKSSLRNRSPCNSARRNGAAAGRACRRQTASWRPTATLGPAAGRDGASSALYRLLRYKIRAKTGMVIIESKVLMKVPCAMVLGSMFSLRQIMVP